MAQLEQIPIAMQSGGVDDGRLRLYGAHGHEEVSALFEVNLYIVVDGEPLSRDELDGLLDAPCAVALGPDPSDIVRGVISDVRMLDTSGTLAPRYVAKMVPTMWLLTLNKTNRLFQNMSTVEIVEAVFAAYSLEAGPDYEIRTVQQGTSHEYVVQYQESDWDFVQRLLEHAGLFSWFEHGNDLSRLVIADNNDDTSLIVEPSTLTYRSRNDLGTNEDSVWEWSYQQRRVPARVALFDYNYRTPATRLVGKAVIDEQLGFGSVMEYGEHFKTVQEGNALAKLRAERYCATQRVAAGWTDCERARVGHRFTLSSHFDPAQDDTYLVTALTYHVGLELPVEGQDVGSDAADARNAQHYMAHFRALPASVQFRPELKTPRPRIHSIMHGHVESDAEGSYAQIDDVGRYKVRLPFDSGTVAGAGCSRWIRMAQSYSGSGYGSHFPLHKGAEVLVAHIDGDPDRPIIVGTVPHAHTPSPVTSPNLTQSVIHTASGVRIELEDLQE